jgi:hypothetical protein
VPEWSRCPLLRLLEVGEEAVHDALRLGVVGERLADHATGEVERQGADLAAQRDERRLALRLDLRVRGGGQARGLGGCGLLGLGDDLLAVLTGGVADLAGLLASLGELRRVLLERGLGLALRLVGLRDVALDGGARLSSRPSSWEGRPSTRR